MEHVVKVVFESKGWPAIRDAINSMEAAALERIRTGDDSIEECAQLRFVEELRNRLRAVAMDAGVVADPFEENHV